MLCIQHLSRSVDCFGASYRVKAYGSAEGCYFAINLLFVHSCPFPLLAQIVSELGEGKTESQPGNRWG